MMGREVQAAETRLPPPHLPLHPPLRQAQQPTKARLLRLTVLERQSAPVFTFRVWNATVVSKSAIAKNLVRNVLPDASPICVDLFSMASRTQMREYCFVIRRSWNCKGAQSTFPEDITPISLDRPVRRTDLRL